MYKPLIALVASAALLTACSAEEAAADQSAAATESGSLEDAKQQDWALLPEYDTIIDMVGDQSLVFEMVEDNQGKRVLLMVESDGTEQYKTIFVKKTNRLKIIEIDGQGLLFNDILKDF